MKHIAIFLILCPNLAFAQTTSTHRFSSAGTLTGPSARPAAEIGLEYLKSSLQEAGAATQVDAPGISGAYLASQYTTEHNGVRHLVFKQQFRGIDVLNAEWTINIDRDGQILNSGGVLFNAPANDVPLPGPTSILEAARAAVRTVNPSLAERFAPLTSLRRPEKQGAIRLTSAALPEDLEGELVWYAFRGNVRPAWLIYVTDVDGYSRYATVVDSESHRTLANQGLTMFQAAKGLVYERDSPQPNPNPGTVLTAAPPYVARTLQSLSGDIKASPLGWSSNNTTSGNNAVVGENLTGTSFLYTPDITTAPGGDFSFPLVLGPNNLNTLAYKDAVNTNLFYWINRAHDLHYLSGFDEASGNFQQENFGRGGLGRDPIYAYSHYGAAVVGSTAQFLNAFFSRKRVDDGAQSMVAMFIGRPGPAAQLPPANLFTDGSLDAGVIVHEYTHGVSTRLARQSYTTFQGASMGEAWSDFFALEFTLPPNAPPDGTYAIAEYLDQTFGVGDFRTRPYSTDLTVNPLTFAHLGNVIYRPEVHADGEIWFEALWDARANLIKQFGDTEGRRRIRLLALDAMKLSPPAATMVDMRDAMLLADRVDFKGASQDQLWAAFAKRGFGATAYTSGGTTVHVVPSFDLPSSTGRLKFYDETFVIGESVRVILQDSNYNQPTVRVQLTSGTGDLEDLILARTGSAYIGTIVTSGNIVNQQNGTLNITPGDFINAYYVDQDAGGAGKLISASASTMPSYSAFSVAPRTPLTFPSERRLTISGGSTRIDLPFQFPFYDGKFKSMVVDENGALFFDRAAMTLSPCTDATALPISKTIAPLWSQLISSGSAQAGEGIYTSSTPASDFVPATFTIRWAAETYNISTANGGRGNPVNFAVTLSSDGTILYNYGTGNAEIGQALIQGLGCNAAATVGISNGHDVFSQAYTLTSYSNVAVRLDPPFNTPSYPNGTIDNPLEGGHVQGLMTVTGVAWDPAATISRVDILIDGLEQGRGTLGVTRADFCATQNVVGCPRVGYSALIDLAGRNIAPGAHTLRIRVTNTRGAWLDFPSSPVSFIVDGGAGRLPYGKVESLADGDTVSGVVTLTGYAAADDFRILGGDVIIDGVSYGAVTYGFSRADICSALKPVPPGCPAIGFRATISTVTGNIPLPDGAHKLQIRLRDETGRLTLIPAVPIAFNVKNGPISQPVGEMTSPKLNEVLTGVVSISGYAYVPGGKITSGFIVVDGWGYESITYGAASPEVCASLPAVTACPNIGFSGTFDTTRLPNGPHVLGVFLRTDTGGSVIVPFKASDGMNVFTKN